MDPVDTDTVGQAIYKYTIATGMSKVSHNYKVFLEEVVTSSKNFRDQDQEEDHDFQPFS